MRLVGYAILGAIAIPLGLALAIIWLLAVTARVIITGR